MKKKGKSILKLIIPIVIIVVAIVIALTLKSTYTSAFSGNRISASGSTTSGSSGSGSGTSGSGSGSEVKKTYTVVYNGNGATGGKTASSLHTMNSKCIPNILFSNI